MPKFAGGRRCGQSWRRVFLVHAGAMLLLFQAAAVGADVGAGVKEIVENQRRILVLKETANPEQRAESRRAGQYLFFRNQYLARNLVAEIAAAAAEKSARYREMAQALDDAQNADEDRLALRATLEKLVNSLPPAERQDANQRLDRLAAVRRAIGGEYEAAFAHVPLKPGHAVSARWNAYLAKLAQTMTATQILAALDRELFAAPEPPAEANAAAARARVLEWNGEELPDRTVLLTFDDGPHAIHTPAILDILKEHGVHAVFFQIGRNLGEVRNGAVAALHHRELEERLLAAGHALGNHSYTHPVLTKLDGPAVAQEIADTQALIDASTPDGNGRSGGFRPPYGARNDMVLAQIDRHRLRSVVWNIDSEDWADPVPESIAHRVVGEAEKYGRGIVLMHDIHTRSVEALPRVIRELKARGFRFARWDGKNLVVDGAVGMGGAP